MSEKYADFYKIKRKFEKTGTITEEEIKIIVEIAEIMHIEKEEDFDFIDDLTTHLMEEKNYQDAFFILNKCAKKYRSEYRDFFTLKVTLVRINALLENKKIELQINPNPDAKSYDHYELIKNGWRFLESHLQSIIQKNDIRLINKAQEVVNKIMMGKGILEERFEVHEEDQYLKNGYGEAGTTKKVNDVVNGDDTMGDDKKRRDGEPVEDMIGELTLETVTEQLEALEDELVNPLNDSYTHLYILLKIVKLQYDKIRLLDEEIAKKREELEKLERIFGDEVSLAGLELLENGDTLSRKKADTQADIDFLIRNKDEHLEEFAQNKKRAQEAIDALDRG